MPLILCKNSPIEQKKEITLNSQYEAGIILTAKCENTEPKKSQVLSLINIGTKFLNKISAN